MRRVSTSVHALKQFGTPRFFAVLGKGTTRKPRENSKLKREKEACRHVTCGHLYGVVCAELGERDVPEKSHPVHLSLLSGLPARHCTQIIEGKVEIDFFTLELELGQPWK